MMSEDEDWVLYPQSVKWFLKLQIFFSFNSLLWMGWHDDIQVQDGAQDPQSLLSVFKPSFLYHVN